MILRWMFASLNNYYVLWTSLYWVGQKVPLAFKYKQKTYFSFSPSVLLGKAQFCSTAYCHFPGNFKIPSFPNFYLWAKNCFRCILQFSSELKIFPLREFCKDWNKYASEGSISGEYGRWIRTSHPKCLSFCLIIKEICNLLLTWWKWEGNRQEG